MISLTRNRVRIKIDTARPREEFTDVLNGQSVAGWRGSAMDIEFAVYNGDDLVNVADYSSILVELRAYNARTTNLLMSKTIAVADMNTALSTTEWEAGTAQHGTLEFLSAETNLDLLGQNSRDLWMVFSAVVAADAEPVTLGGGRFTMFEDGSLVDSRALPPLGSSLIPPGTNYSGTGQYVLTVLPDRNHQWTKAANDLTLVNGTQTLSATGTFVAQGSTVLLTGTPNALITATVRYPIYLTADDADARYLQNVAKVIKPAGVIEEYRSANGSYRRLVGVSNAGLPIDKVEAVP